MQRQLAAKETICDGLDDDGNGIVDEGLVLSCSYPFGNFNLCKSIAKGCPTTIPTFANPFPTIVSTGGRVQGALQCLPPAVAPNDRGTSTLGPYVFTPFCGAGGVWNANECACECARFFTDSVNQTTAGFCGDRCQLRRLSLNVTDTVALPDGLGLLWCSTVASNSSTNRNNSVTPVRFNVTVTSLSRALADARAVNSFQLLPPNCQVDPSFLFLCPSFVSGATNDKAPGAQASVTCSNCASGSATGTASGGTASGSTATTIAASISASSTTSSGASSLSGAFTTTGVMSMTSYAVTGSSATMTTSVMGTASVTATGGSTTGGLAKADVATPQISSAARAWDVVWLSLYFCLLAFSSLVG